MHPKYEQLTSFDYYTFCCNFSFFFPQNFCCVYLLKNEGKEITFRGSRNFLKISVVDNMVAITSQLTYEPTEAPEIDVAHIYLQGVGVESKKR